MHDDPLAQEARRQNRIAEKWLLDIDYYHAEYEAKIAELEQSSAGGIPSIPSGNSYLPTDSTGRVAIEMSDVAAYYGGWFNLVRDMEVQLPHYKRLLLLLRRDARSNKAKREGWSPHLQRQYDAELARVRGKYKQHNRYYLSRVWREIVEQAARVALKRGLFNEE